jgi:Secretory lipase
MRAGMHRRSIGAGAVLALAAGGACDRAEQPASESEVVPATEEVAAPASSESLITAATQDVSAGVTARAPDAFYVPPAEVPGHAGALLRREPLRDVTLPAGMQAWRILYTTTVDDQTAATAVATVLAPADLPPGPRPVVTWAHGTTGVLQKCMPSLLSAPTEGIPARDDIVAAGWVIVATDYSFTEQGGPHPYIIGEGEARAALDSVRAARQMPELVLDDRTAIWGHSQGGHAALWVGIVASRYAPELEVVGVAAIAPAADIRNILATNVPVDQRLGAYVAAAYSRFYPDITFEGAVRPEALEVAREVANLCGFMPPEDPQRIAELTSALRGPLLATASNAALAARLAQNTADDAIAAPLLVAQGLADTVVPPRATDRHVDERCAVGQRLDYWTFAELDHGAIVQPGSALEVPLIAWTKARFANEPQAAGCARRSR